MDHIYVNVYNETQHYGGPEEGGWYYWSGIPIWTANGPCSCPSEFRFPAHTVHCPITSYIAEADGIIQTGEDGYLDSYITGDPDRAEYRPEAVYSRRTWYVEDHPPTAYPTERPHYE